MIPVHHIGVHGVTGRVRTRDWCAALYDRVGLPDDQRHSVYWADAAQVETLSRAGDTRPDRLWDLADDFIVLCVNADFRERVIGRFLEAVGETPPGSPLCVFGHSAGTYIAILGILALPPEIQQRVVRIVTVLGPMKNLAYDMTGGSPRLFVWPARPPLGWFNLWSRWCLVSRGRGLARDLTRRAATDLAIMSTHTTWGCNCTVVRLLREVREVSARVLHARD